MCDTYICYFFLYMILYWKCFLPFSVGEINYHNIHWNQCVHGCKYIMAAEKPPLICFVMGNELDELYSQGMYLLYMTCMQLEGGDGEHLLYTKNNSRAWFIFSFFMVKWNRNYLMLVAPASFTWCVSGSIYLPVVMLRLIGSSCRVCLARWEGGAHFVWLALGSGWVFH